MKTFKTIAVGLIITGGILQAATVSIANFQSASDITAIANPNSTPASGGIVSAGYFAGFTDDEVFTMAMDPGNILTLASSFTSIGSTTLDSQSPNSGLYNANFESVNLMNGTNSGKKLYSFLGNASTLTGSTQFILWAHTDIIDAEDSATSPDSNSLLLGIEGAARFSGGTTTTTIDFGSGSTPVNAIRLAAIPEPSTLLLSALGVLALLRRKR